MERLDGVVDVGGCTEKSGHGTRKGNCYRPHAMSVVTLLYLPSWTTIEWGNGMAGVFHELA